MSLDIYTKEDIVALFAQYIGHFSDETVFEAEISEDKCDFKTRLVFLGDGERCPSISPLRKKRCTLKHGHIDMPNGFFHRNGYTVWRLPNGKYPADE